MNTVKVLPRGQLTAIGRCVVEELTLFQPAACMFQHVNAFRSTSFQCPSQDGFKHCRPVVERLVIDKFYLLDAGPKVAYFAKDCISNQPGTIDNGGDPEPV